MSSYKKQIQFIHMSYLHFYQMLKSKAKCSIRKEVFLVSLEQLYLSGLAPGLNDDTIWLTVGFESVTILIWAQIHNSLSHTPLLRLHLKTRYAMKQIELVVMLYILVIGDLWSPHSIVKRIQGFRCFSCYVRGTQSGNSLQCNARCSTLPQ